LSLPASSKKWECVRPSEAMNWDCTLTEERLSDSLAEALLPEESAAFRAHTADCERCRQLVARVGGIVVQLQQLPPIQEPPFLASRIVALTRGMPPGNSATERWPWAIWQTRFVMGLATVAATALIVFHALSAGAPSKLQFSPASLYRGANRRAHLTYARGVKFVNDLRVVYEIQSRLSSQPEPDSQPAPEERRPDSDALPRPQTDRPPRGLAPRRFAELAVLRFYGGPQSGLSRTFRSVP
jgi:hypothetical protein